MNCKNTFLSKNTLSCLLAPGGAASFTDGVRQERYSGSRDDACWKSPMLTAPSLTYKQTLEANSKTLSFLFSASLRLCEFNFTQRRRAAKFIFNALIFSTSYGQSLNYKYYDSSLN